MARNILFPVHFCMQFYSQLDIPSFDQVFHILGVFSNFVSQQLNASFPTLTCYLSYFARVQFIFYFNHSIAFIIPVLTTFVQLKYQGNDENKSPFAAHPRAMRVAVSSSVVYYLAYIALLRYPLHRFAVVAHHCLVSSGYAAVASLASLLLPNSLSRFLYAVFVLLSASELLCWLYHKLFTEDDDDDDDDDAEFQVLRRRSRRFLNNIWRVAGNSSRQLPQILPI